MALLGALLLGATVRDTASFTVVDDPPKPLMVEAFARHVAAGGAEGPYADGAGSYGMVIPGTGCRVDLGIRLLRRGAEAPMVRDTLFDARFPAEEVPSTPFTLVEQIVDVTPGSSTQRLAYGGQAFFLVVDGAVRLEREGSSVRYRLGEHFSVPRGEMLRLANSDSRGAAVLLIVLLPEATRFAHGS